MTEKETMKWMKNNTYAGRTYHSMWVTPVLGCNAAIENDNGKIVTCYDGRPVGNLPETMCLDNCLINNVHGGVRRNVGATYFLDEEDPRKFSLTTPNHIVSAY